MKLKPPRVLKPSQWDSDQLTLAAQPPSDEERRTWAVNWPLLIGTIVVVLSGAIAARYWHHRQVEQHANQLLALADQAEQEANWPLVIMRLNRYLAIRRTAGPGEDYEATRRLADIYYTRATTREEITAGMRLYSRCLPEYPDDVDLKLRHLAMLTLIHPTAGLHELDDILEKGSILESAANLVTALRLRIRVLEYLLPTKLDRDLDTTQTRLIADYEQLTGLVPEDARSIQKLAILYRRRADAIKEDDSQRAEELRDKADAIMDAAVEAHPTDIDVRLLRFEYRHRYSQTRYLDTSDLQRILELDPANPRALLSLAVFLTGPRVDPAETSPSAFRAARDFLRKSLKDLPTAPVVLVTLAKIHILLGDAAAAEDALRQAAADFPDSHMVHAARAELALSQRRFDDALVEIRQIHELAQRVLFMARSTPDEVMLARVQQSVADVLEAQLLLESGDGKTERGRAMALLNHINLPRLQTHDRTDVLQQMSRLYARMQAWKETTETIECARSSGIVTLDSEFLLANCYERMEQYDRAISVYREITSRQITHPRARVAWFRLGMLYLRTQLRRTKREQQWDDLQGAVDALSRLAPASEETFILKMYLQLGKRDTGRAQVIAELKAVEDKFRGSAQYWLLCANIYRQLEEYKLLQEAMDQLGRIAQNIPNELAAAARQPALTTRLSPEDLRQLQQLNEHWSEKTPEERVDSIRRWCENAPNSIAARFALVNLGTALQRPELVEEAVQSLRGLEAGTGFFWRIADIQRDLTAFRNGNPQAGGDARRKAEDLANRYPSHPVSRCLAAVCQESCGDLRAAAEQYARATKFDPTPRSIDGRLRTLVHQRNWTAARQFIEQLPPDSWLDGERLELVVNVLCEHREFNKAVEILEQAGKKNGSDKSLTNYLMAVVCLRDPSREHALRAHEYLLRAAQLAPSDPGYWVALYHLEISDHPEFWTEDACRTASRIRWLLAAYGPDFAPCWSSLILAQTLRLRGRLADADAFLRKTIALEPETVNRGWIPNPILSLNATANDSPVTPAIAWLAGDDSARTLAALQAFWHGQAQTGLEIRADDTRVLVQLAVSNGDEAAAIAQLESISPQHRGVGDHLLLAVLCDRAGDVEAARTYRLACVREPSAPTFAVQEVLNHALANNDAELARQCVQLLNMDSISPVSRSLIAARIELGSSPIPEDIGGWVLERQRELADEASRHVFLVELVDFLADQGHDEAATQLLSQALESRPTGSPLLGRWMPPSLLDAAMQQFDQARTQEPTNVVLPMMCQLARHVPLDSPHYETLVQQAQSLLDSDPKLAPEDWITLSSVFERLRLPEVAVRACARARPENGGPSLVEHHLIWLRAGYLGQLATAQEELDHLTRQFGPRVDLQDTRVVMLLLNGQAAAAAKISRELTLFDPLHTVLKLHDRLAAACLMPTDQRHVVLDAIDERVRRDASLLAVRILERALATE